MGLVAAVKGGADGMVRMQDVADVVGVSAMTVSNAFNRPDQLSPQLRERILARAAKMGYGGPSAAARALRQGRTHAFGVVFPGSTRYAFTDPFTIEWLAGFATAMEPSRSNIVLMSVDPTDGSDVHATRNTAVDGLASTSTGHAIVAAARAQGLPVVLGEPVGDCFVAIDEYAAGVEVGRFVRGLGHQRVCLLSGRRRGHDATPATAPAGALLDPRASGVLRLRGIADGLGDRAVPVVMARGWDRADATEAAGPILGRSPRPTCVIALTDNLALGLLDALTARGLAAGPDVCVIGFDDIPGTDAAGLTTLHQPIRDKGRHTGELLLDATRPRTVTLPHRLIVRASTGPYDEGSAA